METVLLSSKKQDIDLAAKLLNNGGVVAIPTETVYGLAANALDSKAVEKIFVAKGRPMDNPLIVHVANIDDIIHFGLVDEIPENAKKLMQEFWPGPLTIIMNKGKNVVDEVSAGLPTVAIRFPSHKVAQEIIKVSNLPLAAPSANISGSPSPTTFSHVKKDMMGKVDGIVDGGDCNVGVESTVITMATQVPRILRPGYITKEDIESVIGKVEVDKAVLNQIDKNEKVSSPGMKYKHYAPKVKVVLIDANSEQFLEFVNKQDTKEVACICYDEDKEKINLTAISIGHEKDQKEQAKNLFDALRKVDEFDEIKLVYAHLPQARGVGMAIYNRLIRAAGFEVITIE